jgi:hypothetical protein
MLRGSPEPVGLEGMHAAARQTASRGLTDTLRRAALSVGARLDCLVRPRAEALSRRTVVGAGVLAVTVVAIAHLRGADLRAGLAAGQPGVLPQLLPSVTGTQQERPGP